MKRILKRFSLVLLLACSAPVATVSAQTLDSEKNKSYSKSYPLSSSDRIVLDNSFGEMKISTWNKSEIKVDVVITVKATTDQRAQEILDVISIEDSKKGSEVMFKTHIKSKNINNSDDDNKDRKESYKVNSRTSFKINYTVFLPNNMALEATNQFGAMTIGDYDGGTILSSKFGSLTAGKLSQFKKISVEFGKATIESITNGKLSVSFSKAEVNKLSGDIDANFNQAQGVKLNLDNNLKTLEIDNNFSTVYLDAQKNLSASFTIKSSFGNFWNKSEFAVNKNVDKDERSYSNSHSYSGKSGGGTIPVTIKNNFGRITLGHGISFDVNEKGGKGKPDKA